MQRPAPSADDVRAALERVLAGESFKTARRSADLLRYVVTKALEAPGQPVKEYELGAEALGRGEKFDPRIDPIARVEASRVRSRLELHYAGEGAADPIRIELPKGGYTPVFNHKPERAPPTGSGLGRREMALWALSAVAAALVIAVAVLTSWKAQAPVSAGVKTFDAALGAPGVLADQVGNSLALSPDGKTLLMLVLLEDGSTRLFVRQLDALDSEAVELPGTAGAFQPFFSPDGRWVGFFSNQKLKKTLVDGGGSPVVLADAGDIQGLAWSSDGNIYGCVPLKGRMLLRRLPETGGDWTLFPIELGESERCAWPAALPDAQGLLLTVFDEREGPGKMRVEAVRLDGSGRTLVASGGSYSRYSPSGHALYVDRGTLFAVEFDTRAFHVKGQPRPTIRGVSYREPFWFAHVDIAGDGTLIYLRSTPSRIDWLDGGDLRRSLLDEPARYFFPRLSPDGRQLAYSTSDGPTYRSHQLDLQTGRSQRIGNEASNEGGPLWTPDGDNLLVTMYGAPGIAWRKSGSTDDSKRLLPGRSIPWSFSPDGKRLAYYSMSDTHFDLWTVPIESGPAGVTVGEPELFLKTPAVETYPAISPDGKWMAYNSNISGEFEVYVRAIPDNGAVEKVSSAGGRMATWSKVANEIFFATNDQRVMVATYSVHNGKFKTEATRLFSSHQLSSTGVLANYDLAPDGKSVVALVPALTQGRRERDQISAVVNFSDGLRRPQSD